MERELEQIAERIKRWRSDAGLTLQELADRSAVSASTIHKIENCATVPTIAVLLKLANGLHRRADELLVDASDDERGAFTSVSQRAKLATAEGITLERVACQVRGSILELWRGELDPGKSFGYESEGAPWQYEGEIIILGDHGQLTVEVGEEKYRVGPGDCLHFRTDTRHGWRNETSSPASVFFFSVVPRGLQGSLTTRLDALASV